MRYYFAPMEGITDSIYRRTHHKYFPGLDRYYMPFLSPTMHRTLTHKESRELPMADSESFVAIPQILTKIPGDFLWAAQVCQERGYEEVNLNVGCPSGTVVAKGKGAGMLRSVSDLDAFLDAVFSKSPIAISVKTRLGMEQAEEFPALLEVFNRYPIKELTIHPRVRKQFYSGGVDMEMFRYAVDNSRNPLCYNGNLNSTEDIAAFSAQYPQIEAVMLGRGLIGDPGMLTIGGTTKKSLQSFADELLENYIDTFGGARNAMFRMKENWGFLRHRFQDSEKLWKQLRKTTDVNEYRAITNEIFATLPLAEKLQADW
jgi:tRNA-dihydrouridine synthase